MVLNYSLCLITRREDGARAMKALRPLLDEESQSRIGDEPWRPESERRCPTQIGTDDIDARGIAGVVLREWESIDSYCFSFRIQLEPVLYELVADHGFDCFVAPGNFGTFWTSVYAGEKYWYLEMSAGTSGMSRMLEQSGRIQSMWEKLARDSNAIAAYVDLEDKTSIRLYPTLGDFCLPDVDTLTFVDDYRFSVDRVAEFIRLEVEK